MTLKTWSIEVKVDFDTPEREGIMLKAVRAAAKQLLTTALLIADKRKPDIAVQSDDMFMGREQVELLEEDDFNDGGC